MMNKTVYLENPVSIYELQKTYHDDVEYISDTSIFPLVTGIMYSGKLHKAIKGKLQPKDVKEKIETLLDSYKKNLFTVWNDHISQINSKLDVKKVQKADDESDSDKEKKKQVIAGILATLGANLAGTALDYYKQAYLLGKERGVSISGQDFKEGISEEAGKQINDLNSGNQDYLRGFMNDLETKYSDAIDTEYANDQAEENALAAVSTASESRLGLYVTAILSALAYGLTDGILEGQDSAREDAEDNGEELPDEVTGIIWITNHDDAVCDGCADNDGKFFTFDEFEEEYQNNECLTRCRCAESSEPTTSPAEHFGKSLKYSKLQKGGTGSGCSGPNCGRPASKATEIALKHKTAEDFIHNVEFHGTTAENAKKIREEGFKTGPGQKGVSTTQDFDEAKDYTTNDEDDPPGEVVAVYVRPNAKEAGVAGVDFLTGTGSFYPKDLTPLPEGVNTPEKITEFYNQVHGIGKFAKGGPGSGCTGTECGRPKTKITQKEKDILDVVPGLRYQGSSYAGKRGDTHEEVFKQHLSDLPEFEDGTKNPWTSTSGIETGFVDKDGKFLSRNQAQAKYGIAESFRLAHAQAEIDGEHPGHIGRYYDTGVLKLEKGGPGSGCQGENCGRPSSGFKYQSKFPNNFTYNEKDPIKTTVNRDGQPVDKFAVTGNNKFVPVGRDEAHGQALRYGDVDDYDSSIRVIQDPKRKLAIFRIGGADKDTLNAAVMGDKRAMNIVIHKQADLADRLYGKHKGWTIALASGGTWRFDNNNLPNKLDNAEDLPKDMESLVDKRFIYKT